MPLDVSPSGRDADAEMLLRRFDKQVAKRGNFDHHWQRVADKIWPEAGNFVVQRSPGERRRQTIFDATAAMALPKFAAALESVSTPRQQKWQKVRSSNEDLNDVPAVKLWFDELTNALFRARRETLYGALNTGYMSLGAFGNMPVMIQEITPSSRTPSGGILYKHIPVANIWVEEDHNGRINTYYRKYMLSYQQAVQLEQQRPNFVIPPKVAKSREQEPFKLWPFLNIVEPRPLAEIDPGRLDASGMPFRSLDVSIEDRMVVDEGGLLEFDMGYGRHTVIPGDVYAHGPGMMVLPDVLTLDEMEKTTLRVAHKLADPPLLAPHDGIMGAGGTEIRLDHGGITYGGVNSRGQQLVHPLVTNGNLPVTFEMMEQKRAVVNDAFLITLFRILVEKGPSITATEALLQAQEKGQLLAPVVGRQQSDLLVPMGEREVNILIRQGKVPPLPPEIVEAEGEFEFEFDAPATRFQRADESIAARNTLEVALALEDVDPGIVRRRINTDEVVKLEAEVQGAPQRILRSDEEAEQIAEQDAQARAAQEIAAAAPNVARATKDLADAERSNAQAVAVGN